MSVNELETTNMLLGIMAVVSVLEALLLMGVAVAGFIVYRRTMRTIAELESRQIAPLREKVEAILVDVKAVSSRVSHQTERVDHAIAGTMERVDETAERVKHRVRDVVGQATGVVRGVRAAIVSVLTTDTRAERKEAAAGRA